MFGGRASNKTITKKSKALIESLCPGNALMVDRGFTISEDLPSGVSLIIPPFKKKDKRQFSKETALKSKQISEARVHIERAIRKIKQFDILAGECRLAMVESYRNIFTACAFLVNFQHPFLKK